MYIIYAHTTVYLGGSSSLAFYLKMEAILIIVLGNDSILRLNTHIGKMEPGERQQRQLVHLRLCSCGVQAYVTDL